MLDEKDFIMVQVPGREDVSIQFVQDKGVNNDSAYYAKYVRRVAWALTQALPMHVIENLIQELMVQAQELIVRGARAEGAQKGKKLYIAVKDHPQSPFPGPLQLWFEGEQPVSQPDMQHMVEPLDDEVQVDSYSGEGDDDDE